MTAGTRAFRWFAGGAGVLAFVALAIWIAFFRDSPSRSSLVDEGATYGRILVDSPEIYTRERMVNDRFLQEAWLRKQLRGAEQVTATIQAVLSARSREARRLDLSLASGKSQDTGSDEGPNEPDIKAPAERDAPRELELTPVDVFRNVLAYRDEIRNAIIENQLDDRHDLNGNTLYRLKFDATVIPGADTSAWAQISVRLSNPRADKMESWHRIYARWLRDVEEVLNVRFGEAHDEAMGRLRHPDTRSESQHELYQWASDAYGFSGAEPPTRDSSVLFAKLLAGLTDDETCSGRQTCPSTIIADRLLEQLEHALPSPVDGIPEDLLDLRVERVPGRRPRIQVVPYELKVNAASSEQKGLQMTCWEDSAVGKAIASQVYWICPEDLREFASDEAAAYRVLTKPAGAPKSAGDLTIEVPASLFAFRKSLEAKLKLGGGRQLFAYIVTPKESAHNVMASSVNEYAEQVRSAGRLGLPKLVAALRGEQETNWRDLAKTLERRPLIVGISTHEEQESETKTESAYFGWLLGPRLVVGADGRMRYRHVPSQNSLSALVSVPSWWQTAEVEIKTAWLGPDGSPARTEDGMPRTRTAVYRTTLPGDAEEITSILQGGNRPVPTLFPMEPIHLEIGREASVIIPGQNLWRSTVVTIGHQRSDRIFVMPNMKGIVAEFEVIQPPAGWDGKPFDSELRVWTSEGTTSANELTVRLHPASRAGPNPGQSG